MTELLLRIRNIHVALSSQLSKIEMIIIFLSEIAEMDFSKINQNERKLIEHTIQIINAALQPYKIKGIQGYQGIPEDELTAIIYKIKSLCNQLFLRATAPHVIC